MDGLDVFRGCQGGNDSLHNFFGVRKAADLLHLEGFSEGGGRFVTCSETVVASVIVAVIPPILAIVG